MTDWIRYRCQGCGNEHDVEFVTAFGGDPTPPDRFPTLDPVAAGGCGERREHTKMEVPA